MRSITYFLAAATLCGLAVQPGQAQSVGRLLASNCFQCHGTNGSGGFERLAGETESEIFSEMKELQGDPATVEHSKEIMTVHANGYTDAEIRLIANFFATRK